MSKIGDLLRRGLFAPFRALLPKNPWLRVLVYALPFVLVLALFGPALEVVLKLLDFVLRIVEPLLQTTLGRILLLLVVFTLGGLFTVWLLRSRVRTLRGEAVLGRHLQAIAALVGSDPKRTRDLLRKVVRYRGPLPERYPHVLADAHLKLARLSLATGRDDHLGGHITPDLFKEHRNATHDDILFAPHKTPNFDIRQVRMIRGSQTEVLIEHFKPAAYLLNALAAD
jgi:hypothetical protein